MTVAEADAIVYVLKTSDKNFEIIRNTEYPENKIKLRPFLLIHIYGQFLQILRRMFDVAGVYDQTVLNTNSN